MVQGNKLANLVVCAVSCTTTLLASMPVAATTIAVIGDFGDVGAPLNDVSELVYSWNPDAVLTVGDNDYENNYALSVVPYYDTFISATCSQNRFYPTYGNHDWKGRNGYDETFPCVTDYYKFTQGDVEFFTINSDDMSNAQFDWLEDNVRSSTALWKVVYLHHSPFSSGRHGSNRETQLDYAKWGVDVVLSGHDHSYERIQHEGVYYFVNGLGGRSPYNFENCCVVGSEFRYNQDNGAMRIDVEGDSMRVRFIDRNYETIDDVTLTKQNDTPPESGSNELIKGQARLISGQSNSSLDYYFELPNGASNLRVSLSGGSGDADLYVKYNQQPTVNDYDCRPWKGGNNEVCDSLSAQAGSWYIMVNGYRDFEDVVLSVDWD
ncbi:hypothetical protein FLM48_15785 [Shewanella sp. Scap07]|uniref:pre-peptidase C-terminal domain-containing protein n=1 Tax=Shewanella sp. Scap07 TaxID=2589987 RepID=UPI0015BDD281|nr:pre-peptidase C-terminal domain-containing protein [Shewanella sp. Scap07]QLE86405.1 hypothetical protein FLM48_15785 [Shewanella sp. Scap07]